MEKDLYIQDDLIIPGRELWAVASLSGGPGGQHVNKVSSRITLYWQVVSSQAVSDVQRSRIMTRLKHRISSDGVLQISSDTHRSQHRNREDVREKMAEIVKNALKITPRRIATKTTLGAKRRRVEAKRHRARIKQMRQAPGGDNG
ncbi:MAG: aminoacyl-tRNA hydrolase [Deltaproteobacteria bacterium]|nr:aminoacyl-tRNA hydrolase [Deltaproteobacteria bacterium]